MNFIDMSLHEKQSEHTIKIHAVRKLKETRARHVCPECNTENAMGIIGTRVATLSSITVSQVLASDLDPRIEKERKILAFTNSVQDAAHQAGFVEARNYRFTFRASLQKIINQNQGAIPITDLQKQFIDFWKDNSDSTGQNQEEAYYYRFFPSDYNGKVDIDVDYRNSIKKFIPAFKKEFNSRMDWEILSEFGYNALIGRTLEKTGASAVKFDENKLRSVYSEISVWLNNNNLSTITESDLLPFVNGILHRVRTRGGIDHEYLSKFRNVSLNLWDLNWMRDNRHFLNKLFHSRSRFPRLLTTQPHGRGLLDSTFSKTNNWFRNYFLKAFPLAPAYNDLVNDFYDKLFDVFSKVGLMNKQGNDDYENYAIDPSVIFIENKVVNHICDKCGSRLHVAASDSISFQTKCLDYTCTGTYSVKEKSKPNYYQLVYNRNLSPRIYSSEHTGILERKDRENKEIDFKERPRFNSLNTIVATSTLEMGIDIGTLNSAINNSVPPLTSNFLQRVGRAGRSSGSALITNFAQSKAHDLFYYGEPKDMMEGEIATPGCYLEAKDILYRHFLAYCLDNWSSTDPKNNGIPGRLISLQLSKADLFAPEFLANRIISFIKAKENILLNEFTDFYKPDLDDDSKALDSLKLFLLEEGFYLRLMSVFKKLKEEYKFISQTIKELDAAIKLLPNDEERKSLEVEKKSLWGLKRLLDKRSVLEHLTNVGLLPNYAFPETGVTLNASVFASKAKASDNLPSNKQFEIVRSSKSALREFAPDNFFYSQGFKFAISGLNTYDWKEAGTLLVNRFCSNCDHIEIKTTSNEPSCPKCGDASWASDKNQHVFVKLNTVKSVNFRDKSTLDDSSDDRDSNHYRISRHLKFHSNSFQGAWGMKEIPFGIEYVKNVDIKEINLGLSSAVNANKIVINQIEDVPYHGFVTCKHCGKSSSKFNQKDYKFHYGYCKHKEREYNGLKDDVFEEVYLFREIKTEALKILLPVQEFESESTINMFKAGLELGLKKYYKGNPQHLSIINYSEFNTKNSRFDKYLVLYDNIPGGTGYLEKLFNPADFTSVISRAYEAIRDCSCKAKGKDGCYRCIYTYSNQFIQEELSREKAEHLFKKIVDKSDAWETYTTGLGALTSNGQIEESELEDRFIRSLRNYLQSKNSNSHQFEDFIENGIVNYKFKITSGEHSFYYVIRPQYELGPNNGVNYNTRSDFFISLTAIEKDGVSINEEIVTSAKSIAIYLDGYTYHATEENCRFYDDLKKRIAIAESNSLKSWTLTWSDIEKFDAIEKENDTQSKELKRDSLFLDKNKYKGTIEIFKQILGNGFIKEEPFVCNNSFERLLWMLSNPIQDNSKKIGLMLAIRQSAFGSPSSDIDSINEVLNNPLIEINSSLNAANKTNGNFYVFPEINNPEFAKTKIAIKISDLSTKAIIIPSNEKYKLDKILWEEFWQLYNLIQEMAQVK
jgi:DEAD/DEAH box helicase domain-containing protein